ncbi:MAG: AAA family ATPase [Balneolales bacterium]
MVMHTEVCQWVDQNVLWEWVHAPTARKLIQKVNVFYNEYGRAPGKQFEKLYFEWAGKKDFAPDELEELENDLLPDLSEEYERGKDDFNVKYLLQRAGQYFEHRKYDCHAEKIKEAAENGDMEQAESLAHNFPESVLQQDYFLEDAYDKSEPLPEPVISPWIREGETVFVYGPAETGKSWFSIFCCHICSIKNYEDIEVGEWSIRKPVKSLFVVGERGRKTKNRFRKLLWLGKPMEGYSTIHLDRAKQNEGFSLDKRSEQRKFINKLKKHPEIRLVVFDNAGTLFDLESENDNSEWKRKIKPLFRDLEAMGVAHIVIHHTGKDVSRGMRGAKAIEDMADVAIMLEKTETSYDEETIMKVKVTKQNDGRKFKPFVLRFYKVNEKKTAYEVLDAGIESNKKEETDRNMFHLLQGIHNGYTGKEIARERGQSEGTITNWKKKARGKEYLNDKAKLTKDGQAFLKEMEDNTDDNEQNSLI